MKKLTIFLCSVILIIGMISAAGATPVDFDVAGDPYSYVNLAAASIGDTTLSASLVAGLDDVEFLLEDNQSRTFDFIEFTATGSGIGGFSIEATLAFDDPEYLSASYGGFGIWKSWSGYINGGFLYWYDASQEFLLADGNSVLISLQSGIAITSTGSTMLSATVTNKGSGTAPVPEPATMLIVSLGIAGYAAGRRRIMKK